jgi:hypothetical protein
MSNQKTEIRKYPAPFEFKMTFDYSELNASVKPRQYTIVDCVRTSQASYLVPGTRREALAHIRLLLRQELALIEADMDTNDLEYAKRDELPNEYIPREEYRRIATDTITAISNYRHNQLDYGAIGYLCDLVLHMLKKGGTK